MGEEGRGDEGADAAPMANSSPDVTKYVSIRELIPEPIS
jgi:hypothetical protein